MRQRSSRLRRSLALAVACWLCADPLLAAIAFDNASSIQATGVSTITIPAFVVAGSDRLIFVGVGSAAATSAFTTSVIRGGVEYRDGAISTPANATTSCTVTIPASTVTDDLLFLAVTSRNATGTGPTVTDNDTTGNTWTDTGVSDTNAKGTLWWKRATSDTASKVISISGAVNSVAATLTVYSGADTGATPYSNLTVEDNASGDETHAGFTPDVADSFIALAVANTANDNAGSAQSTTDPGTLTERQERLNSGGSDCASVQASRVQAGGPTDTGGFAWDQTNGTTVSHVWAIKPATLESFTEIFDVKNAAGGNDFHVSGHYFVAPVAGSIPITITLAASDDEVAAGAISLTGVDQTTPVGTHGTNEGTGGGGAASSTVTVTAADDEWLVDVTYMWSVAITSGVGQTSRWEQEGVAGATSGGSSTQPGTADDIMSWDASALHDWVIGAVPIKPVAGAPPSPPPLLPLLGVGE